MLHRRRPQSRMVLLRDAHQHTTSSLFDNPDGSFGTPVIVGFVPGRLGNHNTHALKVLTHSFPGEFAGTIAVDAKHRTSSKDTRYLSNDVLERLQDLVGLLGLEGTVK